MYKIFIFLLLPFMLYAKNIYFVSISGDDMNKGFMQAPFKTLDKAISVAKPGDTINIRSGVYPFFNRFTLSGTKSQPITFQAYNKEKVVFQGDYGNDKIFNGNFEKGSFYITGNWLIFKNMEFRNGVNGLVLKNGASYNRFENLVMHDNYFGGLSISDSASYNMVINCDSYGHFDSVTRGEHADGFGIKGFKMASHKAPFIGKGNVFIGCRSWGNSDDGYDCWDEGERVYFINCLAYENGYDRWGLGKSFSGTGGNGFKLGRHNVYHQNNDNHILLHCKSWNNSSRGFDCNDNKNSILLFRNVAWKNKIGYKFLASNHYLVQNISIDNIINQLDENIIQRGNSWNEKSLFSRKDIVSFDDTMIKSKRLKDGSFQANGFLELKKSSHFYKVYDNATYKTMSILIENPLEAWQVGKFE